MDCRWEVFRISVERSGLGAGAERRISAFRSEAGCVDFEPADFDVSAAEQGWEEAVYGGADVPGRADAVRREGRAVRAISRRDFGGVCCVLERWTVGELCFVSRRHAVAEQGGWERAAAVDVSTDVSGAAAVVAG